MARCEKQPRCEVKGFCSWLSIYGANNRSLTPRDLGFPFFKMVPRLVGSAITSRTKAVCQLYSNLKNSTREKQERTKALSSFFFVIFRALCFPPGPVYLMDQYKCHRCHMQVATSEENIGTSLPCIPSQEKPADLSPHPTPASFVSDWKTASQSLNVDPQSLGSFNIHSLGLILPWGLASSTTVNTKEFWSQGRK